MVRCFTGLLQKFREILDIGHEIKYKNILNYKKKIKYNIIELNHIILINCI